MIKIMKAKLFLVNHAMSIFLNLRGPDYLPRCSSVRVIGLLGISGYLRGRSWPTLSRLWKWMLVFIPMMMAGPVALMSSCLSPLMRMKGLVTVLDVVTVTQPSTDQVQT